MIPQKPLLTNENPHDWRYLRSQGVAGWNYSARYRREVTLARASVVRELYVDGRSREDGGDAQAEKRVR